MHQTLRALPICIAALGIGSEAAAEPCNTRGIWGHVFSGWTDTVVHSLNRCKRSQLRNCPAKDVQALGDLRHECHTWIEFALHYKGKIHGEKCQRRIDEALNAAKANMLSDLASQCNRCPTDDFWASNDGKNLIASEIVAASKDWQQFAGQCRNTQTPPREARSAEASDTPNELCRAALPTCNRQPRNDLRDQRDLRDLLHSEDGNLGSDDYATLDQVRILNAASCLPLALKDVGRGFDREEARARYRRVLREAVVKVHAACGLGVSESERRQNRRCPSPSFWDTQVIRDIQSERPMEGVGGSESGTPPDVADGVLENVRRSCTRPPS